MARPQKQTVDYFPHICDTENGKTLSVLQNKYGNDGYAFWFRLLEFLGKRNGLYFDYNNLADLEFLCAKTHQKDTETILRILADLDILGAIDHELYQEKIIWIQNFVDGVADAFVRSVAGVPPRPSPKKVNVVITDQSVPKQGVSVNKNSKNITETPQIKLKEIKLKENKERTTTPLPPPPTGESLLLSSDKQVKEVVIEKNAFTIWVEEKFGELTPLNSKQLRDACEYYSEAWVCDALKEAVRQGVRKWSYVDKILENWKEEGRNVPPEEAALLNLPNAISEIAAGDIKPDLEAERIWTAALVEIGKNVNKPNFKVWFATARAISYTDGVFILGTTSAYQSDYLGKNQCRIIEKALAGVVGTPVKVRFKVVNLHIYKKEV